MNSDDMPDNLSIDVENIRAMEPLYAAAMLEELHMFQAADKLVELFFAGALPIGRGEAGRKLYKYWKESPYRITALDRRRLYARTLGVGGSDYSAGANREFTDLWLRFVASVSAFARPDLISNSAERLKAEEHLRKAGRELAANLSVHGNGIAHFVGLELQNQIRGITDLLSESEIQSAYGARDVWQVIDKVASLYLSGPANTARYRTMASSGSAIIDWLARHAGELQDSHSSILCADTDLLEACQQWLAVSGTSANRVEDGASESFPR